MIAEIQLPTGEVLQTHLNEQATCQDVIQELRRAGKLEIGKDYRLMLAISPYFRLERIVALGEDTFIIESQDRDVPLEKPTGG